MVIVAAGATHTLHFFNSKQGVCKCYYLSTGFEICPDVQYLL